MKQHPVFYKQVNQLRKKKKCFFENSLEIDSTKRCLDYLNSIADAIPDMKEFLIKLFNQYPSIRFAVDIVNYSSIKCLQADELVLFFLQLDQHINAIQFVEQLIEEKGSKCEKEEAEKLQTCFDLLKKYSYLVDEKVIQSQTFSYVNKNTTNSLGIHSIEFR